ncbi:MAG: hypothetical protein A2504_04115 [Bdellovibrionales bacterium RIFOXYD12_FULL_39_22]|nr:MAG: hypothetical protein A2385_11865 [Bdellovibrionales bacterium RIFOXYB1_FULL_39_21]OFZ41757.1 MAG: hypothetical protein A2485_02175 [Bdellovibrionales bacterium RIFOXYC12_FULL_39_17]OFZ46157.1 MAG: hypothetical protein A2404_12540 [Bdellovibrionales bacterium RIFOXYC1_FULL_39_130]OFZ74983.1 MAG: hypothetical protein A2560_15580 [Bdellovibrionales bacterium RIFOXYD1_FULL_39_84]OFZ76256.1 MAG: hypothetical protein A2451_05420 [Bdellovibrionales bacterium RIFOXYC2_FULL_39_8]OFZ92836.1 MAG:
MQNSSQWKNKVNEIFHVCTEEFKRTTTIGKKMFYASQTNSCLKEAYEELGLLVAEAMDKKELQWENNKAKRLVDTIKQCERDLCEIDKEVTKARFAERKK